MSPKRCGRVMANCKWGVVLSILFFMVYLLFFNTSAAWSEKHWIVNKSEDGSIIILDNGSVWQVEPVDRMDNMFWLPGEGIFIPDSYDCLINTDNGEKVEATCIR